MMVALGITEFRKSRGQGWHTYLRYRVGSKTAVTSKTLTGQSGCSAAREALSMSFKKKKTKT